MRKRLLHLIALLSYKAPWLVLAFVFMLTFLSLRLCFQHLTISPELTLFLPEGQEEVMTYNSVKASFGSFNYLVIVFEAEEPFRQGPLKEMANLFASELERPDLIASVDYYFDTSEQYPLDASVNLLTQRDWDAIQERLTPEALRAKARSYMALFSLVEPRRILDAESESWRRQPFDVIPIANARLQHLSIPFDTSLRDAYILSPNERQLLMIVRPQEPATNHRFSEELVTFLSRCREGWIRRLEQAENVASAGIEIRFIGAHIEAAMTARQIKRDLLATSFVSLVGVTLLFLLVFRRVSAMVNVVLPVVIGVIWTLGFSALIYGRLTMITFSLSAVLVGLGVDFGIHIYNRFLEEIRQRSDMWTALDHAIVRTGEGLLTAALTTSVAFFGLVLTASPGFKELGVIGGIGVLSCLVAVYLTLPPLMLLRDRWGARRHHQIHLASFGLRRLATLVMGYPRSAVILSILITAYFAFHARHISFSRDWASLTETSPEYEAAKAQVERQFDLSGSEIAAVVTSDTLQGALEDNDRLYANLEQLGETYHQLLSYDSLRTALPSIKTQQESRQRIQSFDSEATREQAESIARESGLKPEVFKDFFDWLNDLQAGAARNTPFIDLQADNPPRALVDLAQRYISRAWVNAEGAPIVVGDADPLVGLKSGEARPVFHIITRIYPRKGQWDSGPPNEFLAAAGQGIDNITYTGESLLLRAGINQEISLNLAPSILIITLMVFLILALHFRSFRLASLTMIPAVVSLIWLLGIMKLMGIDFNVLNVVVLPLIVGIGLDDGVHILQRFFESHSDTQDRRRGDVEAAVRHTGRAVAVTSLTTMIGFGALSLAHHQGLREVGLLVIIGIGFALITTLTLLPTLLRLAGPHLRLLDTIGDDQGVIRESRRS